MEIIETLISGIRERIESFIQLVGDQPQAKVIQDFVIIADGESKNVESIDLNSVVRESLPESGGINTSLQAELPLIMCNRQHAARMVSALVDYFKVHDADDLHIETHVEKSQDRSLFFDELYAGDYVVISVGGNTSLNNTNELERLFDPSLALELHEEHQIGFGLAVVRRVVRELEGGIELVLLEKGGIRIEIYLPVVPAQP